MVFETVSPAHQKAKIARWDVAGKEPVSKLTEELGVQPSQTHGWVNQVLPHNHWRLPDEFA
jgi:hypothetical protein